MSAISDTSGQLALRDPDTRLMLGVRADEPGAFEQLVERYQHRVLAVLDHLVSNRAEAEDLAQEVFLRVYRSRHRYRARAKFSTWLFTIVNHLALNALRNRQRQHLAALPASDSGPRGPRPVENLARDAAEHPSGPLRREELATVVRQALDRLNERQRTAVLLHKFEEMKYAEIAEVMGLTTKAVKSLLNRARTNLRASLQDYVYMDGEPVPPIPSD